MVTFDQDDCAKSASLWYDLDLKFMECEDIKSVVSQQNQKHDDIETTACNNAQNNVCNVQQLQMELQEMMNSIR